MDAISLKVPSCDWKAKNIDYRDLYKRWNFSKCQLNSLIFYRNLFFLWFENYGIEVFNLNSEKTFSELSKRDWYYTRIVFLNYYYIFIPIKWGIVYRVKHLMENNIFFSLMSKNKRCSYGTLFLSNRNNFYPNSLIYVKQSFDAIRWKRLINLIP